MGKHCLTLFILCYTRSLSSHEFGVMLNEYSNIIRILRRLFKSFISKAGFLWYVKMVTMDRIARSQGEIPPEFRLDKLAGVNVFDITVLELGAAYEKGKFTALEYTRFLITRIQSVGSPKMQVFFFLES